MIRIVKFRKLVEKDLPFLLEIRNNDSTRKFLRDNRVFKLDQCKNWFGKLESPFFIIYDSLSKNDVGYFRTDGVSIGCDIHPDYRRMGYARLAYLEYLKDNPYATLWVFKENFAINLYLDLGFKLTGNSQIIRGLVEVEMIYSK